MTISDIFSGPFRSEISILWWGGDWTKGEIGVGRYDHSGDFFILYFISLNSIRTISLKSISFIAAYYF